MPGVISTTVLTVVAIAVLVGLSAFFSSSETAIFTLPDRWLGEQASSSDPRVQRLIELRSDPHRLLVTILAGNNIVNVAIASLTTALFLEHLPTGPAVSVATVVASLLVLIVGEIVPKSYGLGHATTWATRVAGPLAVVERVLYPLVVVLDLLTRRVNAVLGGDLDIEQPYLEE